MLFVLAVVPGTISVSTSGTNSASHRCEPILTIPRFIARKTIGGRHPKNIGKLASDSTGGWSPKS
jgi:hypothetical protein